MANWVALVNEKERIRASRNRGSKVWLVYRQALKRPGRRRPLRPAWPRQKQKAVSQVQTSRDHYFYRKLPSTHDWRDIDRSHSYLKGASRFSAGITSPCPRSSAAANHWKNLAGERFRAAPQRVACPALRSPRQRRFNDRVINQVNELRVVLRLARNKFRQERQGPLSARGQRAISSKVINASLVARNPELK